MSSKELHRKRAELSASLSGLTRTRDQAYRLKSDAEALDRYGVTRHSEAEMARLEQDQLAADTAIRAVQLELRKVDEGLSSASRGLGRVLHRS
jgi:hypothetical protein